MSIAPPTPRELDAIRDRADRFIAALDEEYYLHFGGHKDRLELEPIYQEFTDLTRLDTALAVGAAAENGGGRLRELWRFTCEGFLGQLTREQQERVAALEAELEAVVDGERIGYRTLRPVTANEPDRARRERLELARNDLTQEHLIPLQLDAVQIEHDAVHRLGKPGYVDLYRAFGFELDDLAEQCRAFLDSTESLYEQAADRLFRERLGIGLDEAERWDTTRLFRAPQWDPHFTREGMLPALEGTLADLGIDLRSQPNVELDIEQREKKSPRAFCAPIEVPGRVVLVIQPIGGADDWRALFHEAGHTEHFAHTSADLSVEERRLGDNAVTEGWAMLMQHLTDDPAWLRRRLDFPRPEVFAAEGGASLLFYVRRYSAKLLYELEFHAAAPADVPALQSRYVELLGDALKIEPSPTDYLADIDGGFYVTAYLRSWAFEAQLRTFLREQFGTAWFARREAGSLLRELWSEGQRLTADELLREVTGAAIEMDAVAARIRETLHS